MREENNSSLMKGPADQFLADRRRRREEKEEEEMPSLSVLSLSIGGHQKGFLRKENNILFCIFPY